MARRSPLSYALEDRAGLGPVSPGWTTHVTAHLLGSVLCTRQLSLPLPWTHPLKQACGVNTISLPHLVLETALGGWNHYDSHSTEETEAQRSQVILPRFHKA